MSIRLEVAVCLPEEHWHLCVSTLLLVGFFSLVLKPHFTLHTDLQMKNKASTGKDDHLWSVDGSPRSLLEI